MADSENTNLIPPVVTGICDPNQSQVRHHRSLKLCSKLKYLNIVTYNNIIYYFRRAKHVFEQCLLTLTNGGQKSVTLMDFYIIQIPVPISRYPNFFQNAILIIGYNILMTCHISLCVCPGLIFFFFLAKRF